MSLIYVDSMYVTCVSFKLTQCHTSLIYMTQWMSRVSHLHWLTVSQCHMCLIYIDSLWVNVTCVLFTLTQCMSYVSHLHWLTVSQCHMCLIYIDSMSHVSHLHSLNVTCVSFTLTRSENKHINESIYNLLIYFTWCHMCLIYIDSMWVNVNETHVTFTLTHSNTLILTHPYSAYMSESM